MVLPPLATLPAVMIPWTPVEPMTLLLASVPLRMPPDWTSSVSLKLVKLSVMLLYMLSELTVVVLGVPMGPGSVKLAVNPAFTPAPKVPVGWYCRPRTPVAGSYVANAEFVPPVDEVRLFTVAQAPMIPFVSVGAAVKK